MTISRVELQGQVTRSQDFTTIKQNEDNKAALDQTNLQRQFNQSVDDKLHQVYEGDRAENREKRYDAKEKGNESYAGDGGKQRGKKEKEQDKDEDGKVMLKGQSRFDIKI